MYLIKNAFKNLIRNKGRNILVALITFVIILAISIASIINTTVSTITKEYKTQFGSQVTLYLDPKKIQEYDNIEIPSVEQQMNIAKSDYLQKTDYTISLSAVLQNLKALDDNINNSNGISIQGNDSLSSNIKLLAFSDPNINEEFSMGSRSIVSGDVFKNLNECIVSEAFARQNELNPGDTITVTNTDPSQLFPYTMTISGIYQDNLPANSTNLGHPLFNRGNEIIIDMNSLMKTDLFQTRGEMNATYYLKDPSLLEKFQDEATKKGLAPYYQVTTDIDTYNQIVGPVEGISQIVTIFLIVVLIFGGTVLLFLSIMAIRERKYEIGVLRAMGMKRRKVILGMLYETLTIAMICFVLAVGSSITLSQPIANTLLKDQIRLAQEEKNKEMKIITSNQEETKVISEISVNLTPQAIFQIGILTMVLVIVSSMTGILYITRFEPMKILSERN